MYVPRVEICKDPECKAKIFFIKSKNGRSMPMTAKFEMMCEPVFQTSGVFSGQYIGEIKKVYKSHYATCTSSSKFRKGGKKKE